MDRNGTNRHFTPKQAAFVREYLIDLNATQAAKRAGYSSKTAEQQGPRLLENVGIKAAIAKAMDRRTKRTELTQDMVVTGLLGEARDRGEGATHGGRVSAWTTLAKHLGMLTDKVQHTGMDGGPIRLAYDPDSLSDAELDARITASTPVGIEGPK